MSEKQFLMCSDVPDAQCPDETLLMEIFKNPFVDWPNHGNPWPRASQNQSQHVLRYQPCAPIEFSRVWVSIWVIYWSKCDSTVLPVKIRGVKKLRNRAKPMKWTRVITDCVVNNIRIHDKWFGCAWGCPRLLQVRGASEALQIAGIFGDLTATASSPAIWKLGHSVFIKFMGD